jgi:hypothetical protein
MNLARCFVFSVGLLAGAVAHGASDTIQTENVITLDRFGDGIMTVTFQLSASQWTIWKQQYGDRPDVLRRDLWQRWARYELGGFKFEKNDVDRTATATVAMRGGTQLRGETSHEIPLPKEMKRISNTEREWIFSSVTQLSPYDPILTETTRVVLPPEATNVRLNQPGTTFQALVYDVPISGGSNQAMLFGGIGALAVGLILGVVGFLPAKKTVPAPA